MIEKHFEVTTPDGVCDCAYFHPDAGTPVPGVVMYIDIGGLRPVFQDMGRRLAAEGFAVLVPNPFYRASPLPVYHHPFEFGEEKTMARIAELRPFITAAGTARDAEAFTAFLNSQKMVKGKIGVIGYCMGGVMSVRAAAAVPDRIGAAASFHGGGLATDAPDSSHLLAPEIKAKLYFGFAAEDRMMTPEQIGTLKSALDAAHVSYEGEIYQGTHHGWCVKDHAKVYNEAQAEAGWSKLIAFFKSAL
jgi:carboxymethylenebutenolidase